MKMAGYNSRMEVVSGREKEYWNWSWSDGDLHIVFLGQGPRLGRKATLRHVLPETVQPAWLNQIHSHDVLKAKPGENGRGDALVTDKANLCLAVVTADCVPVLLSAGDQIAAVHAGWKGLASSILLETLESLRVRRAARVTAWIGPSIGPCCYEVGNDVADQVIAASSRAVSKPGPGGRPHLDLVAAAISQLEQKGVETIHRLDFCTRCETTRLFSYRRDGPGAGRNFALIWKQTAGSAKEPGFQRPETAVTS